MNELLDDDLLALLLAEADDDVHAPATTTRLEQAPLSFAQQRLWLEQQRAPHSSAYNLPRALRLSGELHADALEAALNRVIDRHDILRSAFTELDGVPTQIVEREARLTLHREDLSALDEQARAAALAQRIQDQATLAFDLRQAPLIRATLLTTAPGQYLLLLNVMGIDINSQVSFWLLTVFYLIMAMAPTIGFAELPVRATASVELFKLFTPNIVGIQAAALGIWLINLVLPAVIGSVLILGVKITKENE